MKLATARIEGSTRAVRVEGDALIDLGHADLGELLARPDWKNYAATTQGASYPIEGTEFATLISRPSKVVCVGLNYRNHITEMGRDLPEHPTLFSKFSDTLIGATDDIMRPAETDSFDWEVELAIVIGRQARRIELADAAAHVLGYSCANDITAIELLNRDPSFPQWSRAKGFDGFGVVGPVIETEFNPATASVRTTVDGRERQNYPLADMFVPPLELVARLSHDVTLEPGDVILCGTSVGVLPMKPGARVEVTIDGIGTLSNVYGGAPA